MGEGKRFTTVHSRYHVGCSCCGLVVAVAKKREAIRMMREHMDRHPEPDDRTFSVFDSMCKGGARFVYGGRIYNGIRSHGLGVAYPVAAPTA